MTTIDWNRRLASIDAKLASTTGIDLREGKRIRKELESTGESYAASLTADALAYQVSFEAAASEAHAQADRAARFAQSRLDDPRNQYPQDALAFNLYSSAAILQRLANTIKLTNSAALKRSLEAHKTNIETVYNASQGSSNNQRVRELELQLVAMVAEADDWLALVEFA